MIITKEVEITLNCVVMPHFRELGYLGLRKNQKLIVPIEHLNKGSHSIVQIKCDICGEITEMEYRLFLKATKFDGLYYCRKNKCFIEKVRKSNFEIYGVYHTSELEEKKNKWKQTNLKIYGCENTFQNEAIKEKIRQYYRDNYDGAEWNTQVKEVRDKNGWMPDEELDDFKLYKRISRKLSYRNKKELLEKWDGYDYYDGEYIGNNFNLYHLDPNFPTIDHKTSIKYGYLNDIGVEIISNIENLCFTKFKLNAAKHSKNECEFVEILKQNNKIVL